MSCKEKQKLKKKKTMIDLLLLLSTTKKYSAFQCFDYISHCNCVWNKLLCTVGLIYFYCHLKVYYVYYYINLYSWPEFSSSKLTKKDMTITCCLMRLEFWCGCLDTATAKSVFFISLCILSHLLALLLSASSLLTTSTQAHTVSRSKHEPTAMCTRKPALIHMIILSSIITI